MSEYKPELGAIGWIDLTVEHAEQVRAFYQEVAGWTAAPVDMGGYNDYIMTRPDSDVPVAGVCHARGMNADLPPVWLVYITVANLDESIAACERLGGKVLKPPVDMGGGRYCVIRDPAGVVSALYQSA